MPRKKYATLTFVEIMEKYMKAGFSDSNISKDKDSNDDYLLPIEERIKNILGIINKDSRKNTNMLCFIMYDIESNKVRRQIVKYLMKKKCIRIQKSIFLADLTSIQYDTIKNDLAAVQACYENEDSILIVPISTDYIKAMKIIGKTINTDIILSNKNTLFF